MALREEILTVIEKNSRIGINELATVLGEDEINVANELKAMEDEGIISGYHTMIDWSKTSIDKVMALIEVKVTPTRGMGFDSISERIYRFPQVSSLYLMSGSFDLMVIVEGRSLLEVAEFVNTKLAVLDTVQSTATHFILKKYKDHGTVLAKKQEDTREKVSP
ncbi:Lrp/AsnC family transcriptional regulator [Butyrivibrio sp. NC3005]|uniref:Lrp/AsnC family transcriptional regulator n=1 Tax=Butyrivibrio sp. NC3005 TaxID=1280685 RepID=UPI000422E1AF|nr:Lrp/AsnC family transcriptional regulator [Butyrivibrio sp. NC3005]